MALRNEVTREELKKYLSKPDVNDIPQHLWNAETEAFGQLDVHYQDFLKVRHRKKNESLTACLLWLPLDFQTYKSAPIIILISSIYKPILCFAGCEKLKPCDVYASYPTLWPLPFLCVNKMWEWLYTTLCDIHSHAAPHIQLLLVKIPPSHKCHIHIHLQIECQDE